VLFRVHSYFFTRESKTFHSKVYPAGPGLTRQGTSDGDPIRLTNVTPEEFETFLFVFYNPSVDSFLCFPANGHAHITESTRFTRAPSTSGRSFSNSPRNGTSAKLRNSLLGSFTKRKSSASLNGSPCIKISKWIRDISFPSTHYSASGIPH